MSNELHYLRSILGHLREIQGALADQAQLGLGSMVLSDNIDWLDCYIDAREKGNNDTAAFLDKLAGRIENWPPGASRYQFEPTAADCRAMAKKLRGKK